VKRRALLRHIEKHEGKLLREGGNHSYWGIDAERSAAVPRHREIAYPTARSICKQLEIPPPEGSR
jgi:mRNA interferase HicA